MVDCCFYAADNIFYDIEITDNKIFIDGIPCDEKNGIINFEIIKYKRNFDGIILVGRNLIESIQCLSISGNKNNVYCTFGIHPNFSHEFRNNTGLCIYTFFNNFLLDKQNNEKIVAIGECGLDFTDTRRDKYFQKNLLEFQIQSAINCFKTLFLYENNAFEEMINLLKTENFERNIWKINVVIYSPTMTLEKLIEYQKMNFFIRLDFNVFINKNIKINKMIKSINLNKLVLSTSSPNNSPNSETINIPSNLNILINKISQIHKKPYDEILIITKNNAERLFNIEILPEDKDVFKDKLKKINDEMNFSQSTKINDKMNFTQSTKINDKMNFTQSTKNNDKMNFSQSTKNNDKINIDDTVINKSHKIQKKLLNLERKNSHEEKNKVDLTKYREEDIKNDSYQEYKSSKQTNINVQHIKKNNELYKSTFSSNIDSSSNGWKKVNSKKNK